MFTKDIGIDLGTANTLVYMRKKGIILREPSVVAVNTRTEKARFVGKDAKQVIGRTPGSIVAVRPLKEGVIADFDLTVTMLQEFIHKAMKGYLFNRARVTICIPSGVTPGERKAFKDGVECVGVRQVFIIEEPMAAAIGAGLPTTEPVGSMIVDIGGGTSEVAVISMGGIVVSRCVKCAGDSFDAAIMNYVKKKYNLLIGERTAEDVKLKIGSAFPSENEDSMEIKGRNQLNGLPENVVVSSSEIRDAMIEPLSRVMEAIKNTLEETPPELSADIIEQGITLAGGGALLRGLDKLINRETGIPVYIAEYPLDCVAEGAGKVLENMDKYQDTLVEYLKYYEK